MNNNSKKTNSLCAFLVLTVISFLTFGATITHAQTTEKQYILNQTFLKDFQSDFLKTCTSPAHWKKKDLLSFGAVLSSGVFFFLIDDEVHDWFRDKKTVKSDKISKSLGNFGQGTYLLAMLTTLYVTGELANKNELRRTALLSLESFVTAGVLALGMKTIVGRARPHTGKGVSKFMPFSTSSDYSSFPSGHAAAAFAVATVIAKETESSIVDGLVYFLAGVVALSRIHDFDHWPSDAFFGSALGYFVGKKICNLHRGKKLNNIKISLQMSPRIQGVTLNYSF